VEQQQQQQQQYQIISSTIILPSSLSPTEIEGLPDNKKAAIAYKLYSQGKTLVDVTSTLFVTARDALTYYRDFWRLKHHYKLYQVYPEIEHSLPAFLKLFKAMQKQG
jgi:hypothetical protein